MSDAERVAVVLGLALVVLGILGVEYREYLKKVERGE